MKKGTVTKGRNSIRYRQPTWNGHYYEVLVQWEITNKKQLLGAWTISVDKPAVLTKIDPALKEPTGWDTHERWWKDYWSRSSISIPDTLLETQYYRDMCKFGSVTRPGTPPISLQAIWTADDGRLPPWKGDYHHDLNTQLSYWPGYTSNHTDLTAKLHQLVVESKTGEQTLDEKIFRNKWNECSWCKHHQWQTHGRMDTICDVSHYCLLAVAAFLLAMDIYE